MHVGRQPPSRKEPDVLKEMRKLGECDMEEFGGLESSSEKTISILGGRWRPQTAKQERDKIGKHFCGKSVMNALVLEVSLY